MLFPLEKNLLNWEMCWLKSCKAGTPYITTVPINADKIWCRATAFNWFRPSSIFIWTIRTVLISIIFKFCWNTCSIPRQTRELVFTTLFKKKVCKSQKAFLLSFHHHRDERSYCLWQLALKVRKSQKEIGVSSKHFLDFCLNWVKSTK